MRLSLPVKGLGVTLASMGKFSDSVVAWFSQDEDQPVEKKGVVWSVRGEMQSCVFCDLVKNDKENKLLFQDDLVAAFSPQKPAAKQHILVIPKKHISTVGDLTSEDAPILARMRDVAEQLLKCDPANAQYSFHIPPWNSIGELLFRERERERERVRERAPGGVVSTRRSLPSPRQSARKSRRTC